MTSLWQDLKYCLRILLKKPGFTLIALLALTLGIGANTAIFSVVNAVLLRPLPYEEPEQLVFLHERGTQSPWMSIAWPNYVDWSARNRVFEHIGVFNNGNYNLTGNNGEPERLQAGQVSADLFAALRAKPALGRIFTADEDKPGANPVVVLTYGLWQRRFGGDPNIVDKTITLNDRSYNVVGVMPETFQFPTFGFPSSMEMWVPVGPLSDSDVWKNRSNHVGLFAVARLRPGVTIEQARAEMDSLAVNLERQYPQTNNGIRVTVEPLNEVTVGNDIKQALWVFLGAVGFLLLIACANVANLLLARATIRQREIAVRAALGASRWRIIRQLLLESVVLALLGGGLGLLFARWGVDLILALSPDSIPRAHEIGLDLPVLAFTFVASALTGVIFGLIPALQSSRLQLHETLKVSGRSLAGKNWARNALVVSEVALTLILLIGAGLLMRSFYQLHQVNPGFAYDRSLSFSVNLPEKRYTREQQANFFQQLNQNLSALPGVEHVGITSGLPLGNNGWSTTFTVEGRPAPSPDQMPMMQASIVSPDYFRAMGIPLLKGRYFTDQDNRQHLSSKDLSKLNEDERNMAGLNVVIIDQEFARRYWPDEEPIGKRIRQGGADARAPLATVVGVVGHVRMEGLSRDLKAVQGYFAFAQLPANRMTVVVQSTNEPGQMMAAARKQVSAIDPNQPVYSIRTLEQLRSEAVASEKLNLTLLCVFAAIALALAVVGIYGVMSYSVTQRTHEIGIRMALGAQAGNVSKMVIGEGLKLTLLGVGLGVLGALGLTRWMQSLLFGVRPTDPVTFIAIAFFLLVVAFLACWLPARRATKVDPLVALRYE